MWVLTLTNSISFQCLKKRPQDFTQNRSVIQILKNSRLEKPDHKCLRTCLLPYFHSQRLDYRIQRYCATGKRKRLTAFALMAFVQIAIRLLKPWVGAFFCSRQKLKQVFSKRRQGKDIEEENKTN